MKPIITIDNGNSPMDMDYYGYALITQRAGWNVGKMDKESEDTVGMDTLFTKIDFEKALKKVSRKIKK